VEGLTLPVQLAAQTAGFLLANSRWISQNKAIHPGLAQGLSFMDSVSLVCDGCGARLKAPASLPAGKSMKCPGCGHGIKVPERAAKAQTAIVAAPPRPAPVTVVEATTTKPCPFCGENIRAEAVKCRHCGEFLETETKVAKKRSKKGASKNDLNGAEYFVGVALFPAGLVIGAVWAAKKMGKGVEMLKVSGIMTVIAAVGGLLYYQYFVVGLNPQLPAVTPLAGAAGQQPPRAQIDEEDLEDLLRRGRPQPMPRPEMKPPDAAELARQPAPLQRASRATVCVLSSGGFGTGVILQKDGRDALIITNRHVVDPEYARTRGRTQTSPSQIGSIRIKFVTGDEKDGRVTWMAPDETDLAIVEVESPAGVEIARWDEPANVTIGDQVFAVGNPSGLSWTTTFGRVSAFRDHTYGTRQAPVVQTDTRIGPGNSGGGLYTNDGVLIGINTFVVSSSRGDAGETGLGFAIRIGLLHDLKPTGLKLPTKKK
jgi:S1-C subfamily serine protease